MIFADTSVWVNYFRGDSKVKVKLDELLDAEEIQLAYPVLLEILVGARKQEQNKLQRVFSAIPTHHANIDCWHKCKEWISLAKNSGDQFSLIDLLIAAIVVKNGGTLWTLDRDFKRMESLSFLKCY